MSNTLNVLFLCTGNSARSILAEAILNRLGEGRYRAYSAGSKPTGEVNPYARALLEKLGYPTDDIRSKNWDEFADGTGPAPDIVITVCDNAAKESCPVWPGAPLSAHWGLPDPAVFEGSETMKRAEFETTYDALKRRVRAMLELDMSTPDRKALKKALADIGKMQ